MIGLAAVHYCTGDLAQAAALYVEGLDRARDRASRCSWPARCSVWPGLPPHPGSPRRERALLGAAEGILASLGAPILPRDQPVRERGLAAMTAALGEERLALAREAGRALTVEEAIAQARAVGESVIQSPP